MSHGGEPSLSNLVYKESGAHCRFQQNTSYRRYALSHPCEDGHLIEVHLFVSAVEPKANPRLSDG